MSRIYEALQKAEAERAGNRAGTGQAREDAVAGPYSFASSAAVAEPEIPASRRDWEHREQDHGGYAASTTATQDRSFDRSSVTHVASSLGIAGDPVNDAVQAISDFDIESIPKRAWAPVFDRLPSLLDRGPAVEQFRSLRSRLYELRDKRPLKTVLVTSGLPQEGKSFVSTNLAISLARNKNARVLLIDGDMRRYTVHTALGCKAEPGLADLLAGRATLPRSCSV